MSSADNILFPLTQHYGIIQSFVPALVFLSIFHGFEAEILNISTYIFALAFSFAITLLLNLVCHIPLLYLLSLTQSLTFVSLCMLWLTRNCSELILLQNGLAVQSMQQ